MSEIIITEFMDEAAVALLSARHDTLYDPSLADRQDAIPEMVAGARALIVRNRTKVGTPILEAGEKLACVGRLGVGLDNIDVEACRARSVAVYPATGANDLSVAEYVMTTAAMLMRHAYLSTKDVIDGKWPRQALAGGELAGRTLGLVGFGSIAREIAWRAHALGMTILAYDPFCPPDHEAWRLAHNVSLDNVLESSDVVSLHTPLTDQTRHLIDAANLAKMKPTAALINAARGGIVDETALAEALKAGKLAGAALDVFETEPLTAEAGEKFAGIANLVLTPHIAGVTEESNVRVSRMIAEKVLSHLEGNA
ncbi:hydroxyacid dehydrogenase [Pararhizobium mangrovi]|uniref:Hydroxyacid dehydrogenase n=1 Tax=Pararhizobium mangrovi TaxID=2590452 RepID=A0A506UH11_9HYPH|nr:hydroxyacid dehydrogenase [Pararhizobium mangrovi]TPW31897.1 hydroxyacid dehydrogenase [Pararhizobium mangrovi]